MSQTEITDDYKQRVAAAEEQANKYKKLVNAYSFSRLLAFLLFVLMAVLCAMKENYIILEVSVFVFIVLFGWLISRQTAYAKQRDYYQDLQKVNENELASMATRSNIYDDGAAFADEKHRYTSDLDIFGPASLYQLVNRAATTPGNLTLAKWLNAQAPSKQVIVDRQNAVKELATKKSWKMDFQASILFASNQDKQQLQRLITYLHTPLNLPGEKWLNIYSKVAPVLFIAAIALSFFFPVKDAAIVIGMLNIFIVFSRAKYILKTGVLAGKIGKVLNSYAEVFGKIENESWTSAYCLGLAGKINGEQQGSTSAKIRELSQLINKLDYHSNMLIGFLFNLFLVWDIRQIIAIENWKRNNQASLEEAFEVVAEFEALLSISGLYINYPEWCIPEIAGGEGYTLTARSIAHPLINSKTRVENDYELVNDLKIDIITGSNMAGKSTFLRTLGINTVLALCGAPVCAASMSVSPMTIITYMRIKDSLNESTSTFKAELDRLQMLLAEVGGDEKVYFLIDEMLRGTNSVDKYKGSKAVIEQLIRKKGVGLVATHDLQIALLEEKYPAYVRNYYFDIQVINGEMIFDYKIKHGECKTFNASLLLKQIGIDVDAD